MLKKLAQCLGLASLILLENYDDFLAGGGHARMHVPVPFTGVMFANIADILILTLVLFAVLAPLARTRLYPVVQLLLILGIPLFFVQRVQQLISFDLPVLFTPLVVVLWPAAVLLVFLKFPAWYARATVFCSRLGVAFAIFAFCSIGQLLWLATWKPAPHQTTAAWSASPQPPRQHPRLVWIVFDELSYDQLFDHRAHDLALPNFDALSAISTRYSNAQPIGDHTVMVLPSLLGGKIVDDYRYSWSNQLELHLAGIHGWHPTTGADSVFGDAQRAGWRTGLVGWYNPYCSAYAGAIEDCYWANWDKINGPMALDHTVTRNVTESLHEVERRTLTPAKSEHTLCDDDVTQRLRTWFDLEQHAVKLLQTDQADFVFLHLPIPHSPGIWSRITGTYTSSCGSSYLDNLAFADVELGKLLVLLKASPRWGDTTLILQGDHSWRIGIWKALPGWTAADEAASRNTFDPRPAVFLHQPGQTSPQTDPSAWSLLNVHTVVEQTLHHSN